VQRCILLAIYILEYVLIIPPSVRPKNSVLPIRHDHAETSTISTTAWHTYMHTSDSFPLKMADCNADDTLAQLQCTKLLKIKAVIKLQIQHKSYVYSPLLSVIWRKFPQNTSSYIVIIFAICVRISVHPHLTTHQRSKKFYNSYVRSICQYLSTRLNFCLKLDEHKLQFISVCEDPLSVTRWTCPEHISYVYPELGGS